MDPGSQFLRMSDMSHTRNPFPSGLDERGGDGTRHPRTRKRQRRSDQTCTQFSEDGSSNSGHGNDDAEDHCDRDGCDNAPGKVSIFSCPWYKFDMEKYNHCRQFEFKRFADVLQHIYRCHVLRNPYCAICFKPFKNEENRDKHSRRHDCDRGLGSGDFIAEAKFHEIKPRNAREDGKTKWYTMFQHLFPDKKDLPKSMSLHRDIRDSIIEVQAAIAKVMFNHPQLGPGNQLLKDLLAHYNRSSSSNDAAGHPSQEQHTGVEPQREPQGPSSSHSPGTVTWSIAADPGPSNANSATVDELYDSSTSTVSGEPTEALPGQPADVPIWDDELLNSFDWLVSIDCSGLGTLNAPQH